MDVKVGKYRKQVIGFRKQGWWKIQSIFHIIKRHRHTLFFKLSHSFYVYLNNNRYFIAFIIKGSRLLLGRKMNVPFIFPLQLPSPLYHTLKPQSKSGILIWQQVSCHSFPKSNLFCDWIEMIGHILPRPPPFTLGALRSRGAFRLNCQRFQKLQTFILQIV